MEDFNTTLPEPGESQWVDEPISYQAARRDNDPGMILDHMNYMDAARARGDVPPEHWLTPNQREHIRKRLTEEATRRGVLPAGGEVFVDENIGPDVPSLEYVLLLPTCEGVTPESVRPFWELVADMADPDSDVYVYGSLPDPAEDPTT